jgi:hypothetical protein
MLHLKHQLIPLTAEWWVVRNLSINFYAQSSPAAFPAFEKT